MNAKKIDWQGIRQRLEENARSLEDLWASNSERNKKVFQERADRMAKRVAALGKADKVRVVIFQLGAERFCIPIEDLAEITPYQNCVPIPGAPPSVSGVIAVRGEIRCIMDLSRLLEVSAEQDASAYILLLKKHEFGLRVGLVQKVEEVERASPGSCVEEGDRPLVFLDLDHIVNHSVFHSTY